MLWVRVGVCGGTESFIRNLLDGFWQYDRVNEYVLFVSRDNEESFRGYERVGGGDLRLCVCPVDSASQPRRILWENLCLARWARRRQVDIMFIPVYSMPWTWGSRIPYVCVIHDLQAMHYPQYFSLPRRMFLRYEWGHACRRGHRILTDSEFCRRDLQRHYPRARDRIQVMYVPIPGGKKDEGADMAAKACDAQAGSSGEIRPRIRDLAGQKYDYCVSSLLPHKNLDTLLRTLERMCRQGVWGQRLLVISGVGGDVRQLEEKLEQYGIARQVVLTGFVSDTERDYLYEHCRLFLFPSIFEGFGMPPIEAMRRGKRVVMTRCSSLEEITRGRGVYVDGPYDPAQWQERIQQAGELSPRREDFPEYEPESIVRQYQQLWKNVAQDRLKAASERR